MDEPSQKPRHRVPEDGIGDRIRSAREGREWTQKVLSTRTRIADPNGEGISRTVLVGYEAGKTKPGAREIRMLSAALGVTPNWLVLGESASMQALAPSLEFFHGPDELVKVVRISMAMLLLKQTDRDAVGTLLFSIGAKELGEAKLSGLMTMASMLSPAITEALREAYPKLLGEDVSIEALERAAMELGQEMEVFGMGNTLKMQETEE
jgi:transcriptional regulator with XRE-family HTH domain